MRMRFWISLVVCIAAPPVMAAPDLSEIVDIHVIARYETLSQTTQALNETAQADCTPDSPALRGAFGAAFDAWVGVSHLRFGPSEEGDRAFALAFWPDSRGKTPKALAGLIAGQDAAVHSLDSFQEVSIAARGFYALEFLLYDPAFASMGATEYRCALIRVLTEDIRDIGDAILAGWHNGYGALLSHPGENETYRSTEESLRQLFTALSTGLEFTADTRLGRPLGTFKRPRPKRAEARRSGRSLRHVVLSLEATRELAALLSGDDAELDAAYARALSRARDMDDPIFAGVADPAGRFRVESLRQAVNDIRALLANDLGPSMGISAGFNALDGD